MDGLVVVNKPPGMTSRAAVDRVQNWFPRVRLGHAGTLDPLATGVLVICLGRATRLVEYVQRMPKTYQAGVRLGAYSSTDDADGTVEPVPDAPVPSQEHLRQSLSEFLGDTEQTPPAHSAAHVDGRRAYDLARAGREFDLPPKVVRVYRIDVERFAYPDLELHVTCGKGTYIRSLARDLGKRLGCGGYIRSLRRTRIGPFTAEQALELTADCGTAQARVLPPRAAVSELPELRLPASDLRRLRLGQALTLSTALSFPDGEIAVIDEDGNLGAVARWNAAGMQLLPSKVF